MRCDVMPLGTTSTHSVTDLPDAGMIRCNSVAMLLPFKAPKGACCRAATCDPKTYVPRVRREGP